MNSSEIKYSKKSVGKAGENLCRADCSFDEAEAANEVLSNWRAAHEYPMHSVQILLKRKAREIDKSSLIVRRLKRAPSILGKLKREAGMKLHRMQDIAGCRVVLENTSDASKLASLLKNSKTRHILHRENNYISEPKRSGYRGIHLVYKYNASKKDFRGIPVEIQIRSKVQHSWATAVEVASTIMGENLKSGEGSEDWLNYFRYASAELAKLEGTPLDPTLYQENSQEKLAKLSEKLNAKHRLSAISVTTQMMSVKRSNKDGLYILKLDLKSHVVNIKYFNKKQTKDALDLYSALETEFKGNQRFDVVLASASSIQELKKGYPNYFADTKNFLKYLEKAKKENPKTPTPY